METTTTYFDVPGQANTEQTLQVVRKRAAELGIKTILIASTTGSAAVKAIDTLKGFRVIAVSHAYGFTKPNALTFTEENRKKFEEKGGRVLTMTHAFAGVSKSLVTSFNTHSEIDIVAQTLRIFSQGMKVCCEIAMMAADAGLVRTDEDVIAIGGTGQGSDTAIVLKPVNSINFFSMKVREIICKPRF